MATPAGPGLTSAPAVTRRPVPGLRFREGRTSEAGPDQPTPRWWVFALLAAIGAPLAAIAHWHMFASFAAYDDEGDWTIALRSYHLHGSLYHHTYSQGGPFYYQVWSRVFSVTGLPINLDTGRAMTLCPWVLTAVLFGWAVYLLTLRAVVALLAVIVSFLLLATLEGEPMEPAGLALLLVACLVLGVVAVARGRDRLGMAVVGATVAALVLTKENVGVFVGAAVVYGLVVCWPSVRWRRSRQAVGAVILAAVPWALMAELLGRASVQRLLAFELLSYAAIVVTVAAVLGRPASGTPPPFIRPAAAAWCAAGAAAVTGAVTLGALTNGTSLGQLIDGALLAQRHLATIFSAVLIISARDLTWGSIGLLGAIGYAVVSRVRPGPWSLPAWVPGWSRILAGAWICVAVAGGLNLQLSVQTQPLSFVQALPLTWLVIIPPTKDGPGSLPSLVRVLVATLAALLTLQVYPVAGSQLSWSGLGLVVAGTLLISDGLRCLSPSTAIRSLGAPRLGPRRGSALPAVVVAALVAGNLVQSTYFWRDRYTGGVPVNLRGAMSIRWPAAEVGVERQVTARLRAECTTFTSLPGLNKFYFFTGETPPTDLNTTQWMYLQDNATQQEVVDALERIPRACVLENDMVLAFWRNGKPVPPSSPLYRYIRSHYVLAQQVGDFAVLVRSQPPAG